MTGPKLCGGRHKLSGISMGEHIELPNGSRLTIEATSRRNWSIVGRGRLSGQTVFVKQFLTLSDTPLEGLREAEEASAELLGKVLASSDLPAVSVRRPVAGSVGRQLLVYPYATARPLDEVLREDGGISAELWGRVCAQLRSLLLLTEGASQHADLIGLKRRVEEGRHALSFKGLECRNTGLDTADGTLELFDLGPASIGMLSRSAARVLVSGALLNWGRPMSRFMAGPPKGLVWPMCEALRDLTCLRDVEAELTFQLKDRVKSVQETSALRRLAKQTVLVSMGWIYARRTRALLRRAL